MAIFRRVRFRLLCKTGIILSFHTHSLMSQLMMDNVSGWNVELHLVVVHKPRIEKQLLWVSVHVLVVGVLVWVNVSLDEPGHVRRRVEHHPGHIPLPFRTQVLLHKYVERIGLYIGINLSFGHFNDDKSSFQSPEMIMFFHPKKRKRRISSMKYVIWNKVLLFFKNTLWKYAILDGVPVPERIKTTTPQIIICNY